MYVVVKLNLVIKFGVWSFYFYFHADDTIEI